MKIIMAAFLAFSFTLTAHAERSLLTCVADRLQAYNSDIFCDLTDEQVQQLLNDSTAYGHSDALRMKAYCEEDAAQDQAYQCVADTLQAYNSDIYFQLSPAEIREFLRDTGSYGHAATVQAAQKCGLKF